MPIYKAPVDDALFLLNDVFHIERYGNLPGFSDASPDVVEAILTEAAKLSEDVLTPLNRVGDKEGCKRAADGSVTTPTGSDVQDTIWLASRCERRPVRSISAISAEPPPMSNSAASACR